MERRCSAVHDGMRPSPFRRFKYSKSVLEDFERPLQIYLLSLLGNSELNLKHIGS